MKIVQVQKTEDGLNYVLRGSEGELVVIDTHLFPTEELKANVESGKLGKVAADTIALMVMLFGQAAIDGLKSEVDALENLETVYEA